MNICGYCLVRELGVIVVSLSCLYLVCVCVLFVFCIFQNVHLGYLCHFLIVIKTGWKGGKVGGRERERKGGREGEREGRELRRKKEEKKQI